MYRVFQKSDDMIGKGMILRKKLNRKYGIKLFHTALRFR